MARILVAESNLDVRTLYGFILKKAGHEARLCPNCEEALDLLEKEQFDLLITCSRFPALHKQMQGGDLCAKIKEKMPGLPIIMITGGGPPEDCKADRVLIKPLDSTHLLNAIEYWLDG